MSATTPLGPVLLVEDDALLREASAQALELAGLAVEPFDSATRAARTLDPGFAGCVVTDIRMDGMDGLELFTRVRRLDPEIPVILITGHGDIEMAVKALHDGAFDFLAKPFSTEQLAASVRRALQSRQLVLDNRALRAALAKPDTDLVGHSQALAQVRTMIGQLASTRIDVVLEGEAGTGKEYLSRELHRQSVHFAQPFIVVPCATLVAPAELTDSVRRTQNGTLYLDGLEDLHPQLQAHCAAMLDNRDRAGEDAQGQPHFRVIAALRRPLTDCVADRTLGEDLAYRIGSVRLAIPPLRSRRDDIAPLFARFVREALDQVGRKKFDLSAADRKRLIEYDWPGNIRELRSYAFSAVLNLPRQVPASMIGKAAKTLAERVSEYEKMVISEALDATGGNVVRACGLLGTSRKTLYDKLGRSGLDPARFRRTAKHPG